MSCYFSHLICFGDPFLQDISPPTPTPILSFILLFILFLTALKISYLVLIGFFTCFFILITHAGLWLAAVCYVASCATDLSSGTSPAVGGSLCSLGMGTAPPGPPAPGRLHRSISWAGTVHHVCDPTSIYPPLQKTPGAVYFFSLAQHSSLQAQIRNLSLIIFLDSFELDEKLHTNLISVYCF